MGALYAYLIGSVVVILLIFGIIYFILGYGFYRVFKLCAHDHPWAAWVPIYNLIVMCDCCWTQEADLSERVVVPMKYFRFWWVAAILSAFIPIVGFILTIVIYVWCMGWIYTHLIANVRGTTPEEELINGYLCATNPLFAAVLTFVIKPIVRE